MNYQQYQFENNLETMNSDFANMGIARQSNTPLSNSHVDGPGQPMLATRLPLSRESSLLDTIGIQTNSSHFANSPQIQQPQPQSNDGFRVNQEFYVRNGGNHPAWLDTGAANAGQGSATKNIVGQLSMPARPQFGASMQQTTSNHSTIFNGSVSNAATPVQSHSSLNMFSQFGQQGINQPQPQQHQANAAQMAYAPGIPPGVTMPISVQESLWNYIDTMGQIQGPFESRKMDYWLSGGYFPPTLQVTRVTNGVADPLNLNDKFITVGEILKMSGSYYNPFSAIDNLIAASIGRSSMLNSGMSTPLSSQAPLSMLSDTLENNDAVKIGMSNVGAKKNDAISKSKQRQEEPSQKLKNVKDISSAALLTDRTFTYDELLKWKGDDGSYFTETAVPIPVGKTKKETVDPNFVIPEALPYKEETEELLAKLAQLPETSNSSQTSVDKNVEEKSSEANKSASKLIEEERFENLRKQEKEVKSQKRKQEGNQIEQQTSVISENIASGVSTPSQLKPSVAPWAHVSSKIEFSSVISSSIADLKKNTPSKKQEEQARLNEMKIRQQQIIEEEKRNESSVLENKSFAAPTTPVSNLAPWANKVNKVEPVNIPSLEELKKNEKSKMKADKLDMATTLKWSADLYSSDKKEQELKSMLTWAQKPQTKIPATKIEVPVSIKKKQNNVLISNKKTETTPLYLQDFEDSDFVEEQKKMWAQAQTNKKSSASTPGSTGSDSWITVTSRTSKAAVAPKVVNQPTSYISPDQLRNISTTPVGKGKQIGSSTTIPTMKSKTVMTPAAPQVTYAGNSSSALRQEFIRWCKSQMKLDSGIQANTVLEVLFSLPSSHDSVEIISDTIYSNTSNMDGKRFAIEFIKRRIEVESKISDPLTWSEALNLPEGEADDWEFQVVKKKKGRKH
ncbi:hypothetical protein TPHA_0I01670 [Tetrapisispora phaffii CBS 4417]|uniref:GYF domain-containing protein n=1 Tax=Tetrapisispora phaffii (strain ATCC 24235 / CBS 4417 / NBRC 1672 / NRRL Y-8282 / UCD 70-5) TaxID=1071381 RepID=G8BXP3_TETPH|nr:hypothetical protein TPHA_0I01670 [Tetrapisispora phaffii CBS 4417]CCE64671.1 hypothetical protein TPHA_0I01670 [Tetrapisispora phaffii CBS 4417]